MTARDFVLGDDDGVLFLPLCRAADIADIAATIRDTECRQAASVRTGTSMREQARFSEFLTYRDRDGITFRQHLRAIGAEIEQ